MVCETETAAPLQNRECWGQSQRQTRGRQALALAVTRCRCSPRTTSVIVGEGLSTQYDERAGRKISKRCLKGDLANIAQRTFGMEDFVDFCDGRIRPLHETGIGSPRRT